MKEQTEYKDYLQSLIRGDTDIFKQIMDKNNDHIDFDKMIKQMSKLSPKIELMLTLQRNALRLHKTMAMYADTQSNIHLTHDQRV